jgi:hypothetical protein
LTTFASGNVPLVTVNVADFDVFVAHHDLVVLRDEAELHSSSERFLLGGMRIGGWKS